MVSRIYKEGKQISVKKIFLVALLLWVPFFFAFGQETPLDLILILDTSSSMSGSYQKTLEYVTGSFLKEFLRMGDTFHLISFSDIPRLEITRRISGWGDVETIMGRLFLLYPLDPYSDISGALAYGEQYVVSIPGTRKKKVVFISDGDHNPRQGGRVEDSIQNLISQTTARLNRAGIDFYYIPVPLAGTGPSSGRRRMLPIPDRPVTPVQAPPAPPVPSRPPQSAQAQTVPPAGQAPSRPPQTQAQPPVEQTTPQPAQIQTAPPPAGPVTPRPAQVQAQPPTEAATPQPAQVPTAPPPAGLTTAQVPEPQAEPGQEVPVPPPVAGLTEQEVLPGKTAPRPQSAVISLFGLSLPWFIGGILGVILILALIIFLTVKRLQTSPNRTFAHAAGKFPPKPVPAEEPEAQNDGIQQNALAAYPPDQHQRETKEPGANSLKAWWDKKLAPSAGAALKNEAAAIPPEEPGPGIHPDKPPEDRALPSGPVKNQGENSLAVLWDKKVSPPTRPVPQREAVQTSPGAPLPGVFPKPPEDRTLSGPIRSDSPQKIPPGKSYKNNPRHDNGPLMLSLFVEDQNTNIGRRNIHTVKPGYSFTIGGGKSDFLIFLVPIPPRIAELRSDGAQCTFIPRKPEFFPDLGSQPVPNCEGIPIRIISERQYELFIRIDRYEDPLIALNRLLHSVDVPGYWQEPD
ncbi:MAG: VWA domain-containing protein [Spirochaetaceae bacterium]|jgi:hypothetical protein|nr:VWA domain-containing protein [Spirochaetaceae bacterium]